jgi:hypothetical protein
MVLSSLFGTAPHLRNFGSAREQELADGSSQFGFGNRPIDLNFADEFIRYA